MLEELKELKSKDYKINRGDIYYISNENTSGSEQSGNRPAVVVSNQMCNANSGVIEVVYLTTQPKKNLPTHVNIESSKKGSIALCEQILSISKDRIENYLGKITEEEMQNIDKALLVSLGLDSNTKVKYNSELNKIKLELEIYKNMYKELLDKIVK